MLFKWRGLVVMETENKLQHNFDFTKKLPTSKKLASGVKPTPMERGADSFRSLSLYLFFRTTVFYHRQLFNL